MPVLLTSYGGVYGDLSANQAQRLLNRTALAQASLAAAQAGDYVYVTGRFAYEVVPGHASQYRIELSSSYANKTVEFRGDDADTCYLEHYPRTFGASASYCFHTLTTANVKLIMTDVGWDSGTAKSTTYWNSDDGGGDITGESAFWYHLVGASTYPNHGQNDITLTRVKCRGKSKRFITQSGGSGTLTLRDVDIECGSIAFEYFSNFATVAEAYSKSVYVYGTNHIDCGFSGSETTNGNPTGVGLYLHPHVAVYSEDDDHVSTTIDQPRSHVKQFSGSGAQGVAPAASKFYRFIFTGGGMAIETSGEEGDVTYVEDCTFSDGSYASMRNSFIVRNCSFSGGKGISGAAVVRRADVVSGLIEDCTWAITAAGSTVSGIYVDSDWHVVVKNPTVTFSGSADTLSSWIQVDGGESGSRVRVEGGTISGSANIGIACIGAANDTIIVFSETTVTGLWAAMRVDGSSPTGRVYWNDCDLTAATRVCHFNGTGSIVGYSRSTAFGSATFSTGAGAVSQAFANKQARYATPIAAAGSITLNRDSGYFTITGTGTVNTLTWSGIHEFGKAVISLYSQDGFTLGSAGNVAVAAAGAVTAKSRIDLTYNTATSKWDRITQPSVNVSELEMKAIIRGATARGTTRRS